MNKTAMKAKAARYMKIVAWSDADGCFVGTCPGLMFGGVHGDDVAKVCAELCEPVEEVIALMERDGHRPPPATVKREFSGKVRRRLAPAVHQRIALQAKASGESLRRDRLPRFVKICQLP